VKAGTVRTTEAQRVIRSALKQSETVKSLLRQLGDTDETLSLSKRFRRTRLKIECGTFDKNTAHTFGELTLAVHELNMLLSDKFYRD
jgi:hypothetical protein